MSEKKRLLSRKDLRLWQKVTQSVTPLDHKNQELQALIDQLSTNRRNQNLPSDLGKNEEKEQASPEQISHLKSHGFGRHSGNQIKSGYPPINGLDRKEKKRILKGQLFIEARLDLHGMTQNEAHNALHGFIRSSQAEGKKHVLVITGKGRQQGSDSYMFGSERGVLRRVVPNWLREPDISRLIVGFEEAHQSLGGQGALHVRLRARNKLRK